MTARYLSRLPLFLCLTLIGIMLALAGCQQAGPAASPPPLGGSNLIAYVSNQRLFVMGTDRSAPIQLTQEGWFVEDFAWSPDGTRLAFKAYRCDRNPVVCTQAIYTIQPDGNGLRQIVSADGYEVAYLAWSPDGMQLAYSSYVFGDSAGEGDFFDITLVRADGAGAEPRQLFRSDEVGMVLADDLAWSPNGAQIAFYSAFEGADDSDIYLLDVQTAQLTRLTDDAGQDWGPAWSPDGKQVVFLSDRGAESGVGLYRINVDRSELVQLTPSADSETLPQWSPDGSQIAYTADDQQNIFLVNVNGSEPVLLTDAPGREWNPVWSPDGQWIMFVGDDLSIYAQAVRDPGRITLAEGLELEVFALWQPPER